MWVYSSGLRAQSRVAGTQRLTRRPPAASASALSSDPVTVPVLLA